MSVDTAAIGRDLGGASLLVTRSRLLAFARANGQQDPVYLDLDAARSAGHPDLPAPPTFPFSVDLEGDAFGYLDDLGVDLTTVLHGEQEFVNHELIHAGDELTTSGRIDDIYSKRGGLLDFIVRRTRVTNQHGVLVAEMTTTIVVQNRVPQEATA